MDCSFHLNNPRGEADAHLRAKIKIKHGKYIYPNLAIKIKASDWDHARQRVKHRARGAASINKYLDHFQNTVEESRRDLLINQSLSVTAIRRVIDELLGRRADDFFTFFDDFIKEKEAADNGTSRNRLPEKYRNIKNKLYEFNPALSFSDIDYNFWRSWEAHLYSHDGLSGNTVSRAVNFLGTFLREAARRGYPVNLTTISYSVKEQPTLHPYLTIDELNRLYNFTPSSDALENARIWLLIGCYSGQRHSDWHKLTPAALERDGDSYYFKIMQEKTKHYTIIPAHDKLMQMVTLCPRVISQQKFNKYAKLLCKEAGIDALFIKPVYKGRKMEQVVYKKYELVSSHIGRRSFVCNSLKAGISQPLIMRAGGWSSTSSFKKYVQLSSTDGLNQFEGVF